MSVLGDAIDAANARKSAGLGEGGISGELHLTDDADGRAIISGFDVDYEELIRVMEMAGAFFTQKACMEEPLVPLFRACWIDAFLVGLMVHKTVAPHHEPPGPDLRAGSGGTPTGGDDQ